MWEVHVCLGSSYIRTKHTTHMQRDDGSIALQAWDETALSEEGKELSKHYIMRTTRTQYSVENTVHVKEKLTCIIPCVPTLEDLQVQDYLLCLKTKMNAWQSANLMNMSSATPSSIVVQMWSQTVLTSSVFSFCLVFILELNKVQHIIILQSLLQSLLQYLPKIANYCGILNIRIPRSIKNIKCFFQFQNSKVKWSISSAVVHYWQVYLKKLWSPLPLSIVHINKAFQAVITFPFPGACCKGKMAAALEANASQHSLLFFSL